jgi:hypothetical protein
MQTRSCSVANLLLVTSLAGFCASCVDSPTSANESPSNSHSIRFDHVDGDECPPESIICDGQEEWEDDGFEEVYSFSVSGGGGLDGDPDSYTQGCPSYVFGTTYQITLDVPTPEGTTRSVRIMSSGWWIWKAPWGPDPYSAIYHWPPGYWPAVDGSGAEVQIGSAQGRCTICLMVRFMLRSALSSMT